MEHVWIDVPALLPLSTIFCGDLGHSLALRSCSRPSQLRLNVAIIDSGRNLRTMAVHACTCVRCRARAGLKQRCSRMSPMHVGSVPFPRLENPTAELDFSGKSPYPTAGVARESPDQLLVRCTSYVSLPEVCDSDHKPVVARLRADIPNTDYKRRRRHVGKALADFHTEITASLVCPPPLPRRMLPA